MNSASIQTGSLEFVVGNFPATKRVRRPNDQIIPNGHNYQGFAFHVLWNQQRKCVRSIGQTRCNRNSMCGHPSKRRHDFQSYCKLARNQTMQEYGITFESFEILIDPLVLQVMKSHSIYKSSSLQLE